MAQKQIYKEGERQRLLEKHHKKTYIACKEPRKLIVDTEERRWTSPSQHSPARKPSPREGGKIARKSPHNSIMSPNQEDIFEGISPVRNPAMIQNQSSDQSSFASPWRGPETQGSGAQTPWRYVPELAAESSTLELQNNIVAETQQNKNINQERYIPALAAGPSTSEAQNNIVVEIRQGENGSKGINKNEHGLGHSSKNISRKRARKGTPSKNAGLKAIREIRYYQSTTNLLIPKLSFQG